MQRRRQASFLHEAAMSCATHGQHLDIEDTYDGLEEGESLPHEYTNEVVTVAQVVRRRLKMSFPVEQKLLSWSARQQPTTCVANGQFKGL